MRDLSYTIKYVVRRITILDDAIGDAAYAKIKEAMAGHRQFTNDGVKIVTVRVGPSASDELTIRLDELSDVLLSDIEASAPTIDAMHELAARQEVAVRSLREKLGLPKKLPRRRLD